MHKHIADQIGKTVTEKQAAYGDSFTKSGQVMRILYPDGIQSEQVDDALCIVRIIDKLFRIATDRDALGESPYRDIAGYAILGAGRVECHDMDHGKTCVTIRPKPHTPTEARPGRRGAKEVYAFAEAMIETLNLPKNAQKEPWEMLSPIDMICGAIREMGELEKEIIHDGKMKNVVKPDRVRAEATDLANFAMFIFSRYK